MARRWLIGAASLVVVLAAGTVLLAFDPDAEKGRIIEAVRHATGRDLVLAGRIRIQWGLVPTLSVDDAALANMPTGSRPQMATIARLEARVRLLPLLSHRVEIDSVTLLRPDILLETDAEGRGNWQFQRPEVRPAAAGPAEPPRARAALVLHSLRIGDGRVGWRDGVTGRLQTATVRAASLNLGDGPTQLLLDGDLDGQPVKLDAQLGTQAQLAGAQPGPFPVKLGLSAAQAEFAAQGMADPTARQFDGTVQLHVPALTALQPFVRQPLPALRDVRISADGEVGGVPRVRSGTLHVGASDLSALWPGATITQLDASWAAGTPARVGAAGTLAEGPWSLGTGLVPAPSSVALRALKLVTPAGDVAGDLAVALDAAQRPSLVGTLVSNRLDLDRLRSLARPAPAPAPAVAALAPPGPAHAIPPPDWSGLRRADAELQVSAGSVRLDGVELRQVAAHITLRAGVLTVNPASFLAPGGRVDFSIGADASQAPPPVQLNLRAPNLAIDPLLVAAGLPGGSDASVELDAALSSTGPAPRDLLAHVSGHLGLAMVDGELANAVLTAALGNIIRNAGAGLDPAGRSRLRCLALRLTATNGHVTVAALKLDTSRLLLEGSGMVDLAAQTLALHLRPLVRIGGAGVLAPVRVEGDFQHPSVALESTASGGRPGVVLGGLTQGGEDSCTAELTAARDGRAGPMPSDGAGKAGGKPADLLRRLLR